MAIKGFASSISTKNFSEQYKEFNFNLLGKTDLSVTSVGFGSYRIDIRSDINKKSLKQALLSGINLIDTSSTYTNGNSELLIGKVLKELTDSNDLLRENLVIVTKGGYLQGHNYDLSQKLKKENNAFPDLVEYQKGLEHCLHPEFLEDQINRSLERLGIETIDVYLLHNPEYYLKWAEKKNIDLILARKEYYSRIKKAFEYLEKEVQKGRIKNYGISSNTFPADSNDYSFTSLDTVIKIAEEIAENNHFSIIEFPMNLAETAASRQINQSNNMTLLQVAEAKNLGVLINRPLNAFHNNKLINLAEPVIINEAPSVEFINNTLENIDKLEQLISQKVYENNAFLLEIEKYLFVFNELQFSWLDINNISNWQSALNQYFLPRFYYSKNMIKKSALKNKESENRLIAEIDKLFELISSYFNNEHLQLIIRIKENIVKQLPELSSRKNLSSMAICSLRSTDGITAVLVGMTQLSYVEDVIKELQLSPIKDIDWIKVEID